MMIVKLTDDEIREALIQKLNEKFNYSNNFEPEDCYFECEAGDINGDKIDDIHNVRFVASVNL